MTTTFLSMVMNRPISLIQDLHGPPVLNPETFKGEILERPGNRFREPSYLYWEGNMLWIRSAGSRNDPLFLALPSIVLPQ